MQVEMYLFITVQYKIQELEYVESALQFMHQAVKSLLMSVTL